MYVAAVLPYVMLLALLIRGSLLPGAVDGVTFYLVPKWDKLSDWQVRKTSLRWARVCWISVCT